MSHSSQEFFLSLFQNYFVTKYKVMLEHFHQKSQNPCDASTLTAGRRKIFTTGSNSINKCFVKVLNNNPDQLEFGNVGF